jgi:hypothetical protein
MTVWGVCPVGEAEVSQLQIDVGVDAEDLWLVFNKKVSAAVMTREEARQLIVEMQEALDKKDDDMGNTAS